MIVLFIIGIPLLIYSIWIFLKKSPLTYTKILQIRIYNFITFFIILFIATYFAYNSYKDIINTVDRAWAPITVSITFGFVFLSGILLAFIVRNYLLFKIKK